MCHCSVRSYVNNKRIPQRYDNRTKNYELKPYFTIFVHKILAIQHRNDERLNNSEGPSEMMRSTEVLRQR